MVRLAAETGDLDTAHTFAGHAAALAAGSEIPHRQANALYCRALLDHDPFQLLAAGARYEDAGRPLLRAKALEAAAGEFVSIGDRTQARAAFTKAVEVYTGLGAAADAARLQATFRAHGIRRGPRVKHRQARNGWDSLTPTEMKIAAFVEDGLSNPEIAAGCCCPGGRSRPTSHTFSRSSTSTRGPTSPVSQPCGPSQRGDRRGNRSSVPLARPGAGRPWLAVPVLPVRDRSPGRDR